MLVKMLQTRRGMDDDYIVRQYHAGYVYDIKGRLAHILIYQGYAVGQHRKDFPYIYREEGNEQ